jgi:hypothetical protein
LEIFFARKRLWQHRQKIDTLRTELDKLQQQNDSMREGMRRCVTCEYRMMSNNGRMTVSVHPHSTPLPR